MPDRFELVFGKLGAALRQEPALGEDVAGLAAFADELDEIAELRRLSAALAERERRGYTFS
jgi:hypothetical protein